jgi:hypothetical protein
MKKGSIRAGPQVPHRDDQGAGGSHWNDTEVGIGFYLFNVDLTCLSHIIFYSVLYVL